MNGLSKSSFCKEQDLVNEFLLQLNCSSPWGDVKVRCEFFYLRGKTDVVAIDDLGRIIAFEVKLSRWKQAVQQAYRNTCFAHCSYVVLPKEAAVRAVGSGIDLSRRHVGICYIDDGIQILHEALEAMPLQPWLAERAAQHIYGGLSDDVTYRPK